MKLNIHKIHCIISRGVNSQLVNWSQRAGPVTKVAI